MAIFHHTFAYMALQPVFTRMHKLGCGILSLRMSVGSLTMSFPLHAAHLTETTPWFRGSQGLIG
jgi:hypothetical protein